ncbi:MAG: prolipoprotein diacylglyceryl transferase [Clostridia bacterium]|nr:prolipoprotein diacylglyceryl transferase [Clostridia bacterium]
MNLYDEAEKISLLGLEVYRFGFFVLLGIIGAAVVMGFLSWARRARKGTGPLLLLLSLLLGGLCSRLFFCLLTQELGAMMPLSGWANLAGGGWSMMGLVAGVLAAGWLTGKMTRQPVGLTLDIAACALPIFMALERTGEGGVPEFDYSRPLMTSFLNDTFLTFAEADGYHLATYRLAALVMLILLPILVWDMTRSRRDGDTCLLFLLLFGGCSVILESLRYDRFLSITFVGLEHVMAAVYLGIGVIILAARAGKRQKKLGTVAVISIFLAAGIAIGLEFALDRTGIHALLLYGIYLLVMAVPVALGIRLRSLEKKA